METHMNQIDDNNFPPPSISHHQDLEDVNESQQQSHEFMTQPQSQSQPQYRHPQQIYPFDTNYKRDIFTDIDKSVYIVIFIAFILGFFMGKTMQPVILRPTI